MEFGWQVDLGIEAKIRNIEETESSKLRLLREAQEKKVKLQEATSFNQVHTSRRRRCLASRIHR